MMILTTNGTPTGGYANGKECGVVPNADKSECGICGLVWYGKRLWTCPANETHSYTIGGVSAPPIYRQITTLRRIRGEVKFKRFAWEHANETYVSFTAHFTGRMDPAKALKWGASATIFRTICDHKRRNGGDPREIAARLRRIRQG